MSWHRQIFNLLLSAAMVSGCTIQRPAPSSLTSLEKKARTPEPTEQSVIDPAGRWSSRARSAEPPRVVVKEGHSHVELDLTPADINCFVYDEPLQTGPAITRLLNAMETGIEFERVVVAGIDAIEQEFLLRLQVPFVTTTEPADQRGVLRLAMSPRLRHPVVCTQEVLLVDEPDRAAASRRFDEDVKLFVRHLNPPAKFADVLQGNGGRVLISEGWLLTQGDHVTGYRRFAAHQISEQKIHYLSSTVLLVPEDDRLQAMDFTVVEESDESGLSSSVRIAFSGEEPMIGMNLKRRPAATDGFWSYEHSPIPSLGLGGPSGVFSTDEPLRGDYHSIRRVQEAQGKALVETYLSYAPQSKVDGPIPVRIELGDGKLSISTPDWSSVSELDEAARPVRWTSKDGVHGGRLVFREPPR